MVDGTVGEIGNSAGDDFVEFEDLDEDEDFVPLIEHEFVERFLLYSLSWQSNLTSLKFSKYYIKNYAIHIFFLIQLI